MHPIAVSMSGCAGLNFSAVDFDSKTPGEQPLWQVKGGTRRTGRFAVSQFLAAITTQNSKSPQRCVLTLTATGPTNPDLEPSNNSTKVTIDAIDRNDILY
jgi:hypothetical protein